MNSLVLSPTEELMFSNLVHLSSTIIKHAFAHIRSIISGITNHRKETVAREMINFLLKKADQVPPTSSCHSSPLTSCHPSPPYGPLPIPCILPPLSSAWINSIIMSSLYYSFISPPPLYVDHRFSSIVRVTGGQ